MDKTILEMILNDSTLDEIVFKHPSKILETTTYVELYYAIRNSHWRVIVIPKDLYSSTIKLINEPSKNIKEKHLNVMKLINNTNKNIKIINNSDGVRKLVKL